MGSLSADQDPVDSVVNLLYEAVLDEARWQDLAKSVAAAFDSHSAVFKICGGPSGPRLETVTDNLRVSASQQSWSDHWHRNDLWVERATPLPMGHVFTSQSLLPEAQFERSGYYQDWNRRLDIYHMVGVMFPIGHGEVGVLGAHRPRTGARFHEAERTRLASLFPHVRRALGLRDRLRDTALAQRAALDALERLPTGVMVVDASCAVLYANRASERVLAGAHEIGAPGRRLRLENSTANHRLARLVREAVQTAAGKPQDPGATLVVARAGRLPITLLVAPWRAGWATTHIQRPAAMVFINDPESAHSFVAEALREMFGMTRAEAVIAVAVGEGRSLEQIAITLGVGAGTVRTHLKKALTKTGTHRQAELAVLVARSVALISG